MSPNKQIAPLAFAVLLVIVFLISPTPLASASPTTAYENAFTAYFWAENSVMIGAGDTEAGATHVLHILITNISDSARDFTVENTFAGADDWTLALSDDEFSIGSGSSNEITLTIDTPAWHDTPSAGELYQDHLDNTLVTITISDNEGGEGSLTAMMVAIHMPIGGYTLIAAPATDENVTTTNLFPGEGTTYVYFMYLGGYHSPNAAWQWTLGWGLMVQPPWATTLLATCARINDITVYNVTEITGDGAAEAGNPPTKPLPYLPEFNSTVDNTTPYFEWENGENANSHRLLVDNDVDFLTPNENRVVPENNYQLPTENSLDNNSIYYWRVVAANENGENESATWDFTIGTVGTTVRITPPSSIVYTPSPYLPFAIIFFILLCIVFLAWSGAIKTSSSEMG